MDEGLTVHVDKLGTKLLVGLDPETDERGNLAGVNATLIVKNLGEN